MTAWYFTSHFTLFGRRIILSVGPSCRILLVLQPISLYHNLIISLPLPLASTLSARGPVTRPDATDAPLLFFLLRPQPHFELSSLLLTIRPCPRPARYTSSLGTSCHHSTLTRLFPFASPPSLACPQLAQAQTLALRWASQPKTSLSPSTTLQLLTAARVLLLHPFPSSPSAFHANFRPHTLGSTRTPRLLQILVITI